jgi:hypothetical protein
VSQQDNVGKAGVASYGKTAQFHKFVQLIKVGYNRRNQSAINLGQCQGLGNQDALHQYNS